MSSSRNISRLGVAVLFTAVLVLGGGAATEAKRFGKHGKAFIPFDLAPGANSDPIELPSGQGVQVMGVQTTVGNRGVGQVTILHPSEAPAFIEWVGLESPAAAAITSGFSSVPGTHIVYIDYAHTVDIEVNDADTVRVHNGNAVQQTGYVTMLW